MKNILCSSLFKGLSLAVLALATTTVTTIGLTACGGGGGGATGPNMEAAKSYMGKTVTLLGRTPQVLIEFGDLVNSGSPIVNISFGWGAKADYEGYATFTDSNTDTDVTTITITGITDDFQTDEQYMSFYSFPKIDKLTLNPCGFTLTRSTKRNGTWAAVEVLPANISYTDSDGLVSLPDDYEGITPENCNGTFSIE